MVVETTFVARCFALTVAPGSTAPELSTTRPEIVDVVVPCPYTGEAQVHSVKARTAYSPSRNRVRFIEPPIHQLPRLQVPQQTRSVPDTHCGEPAGARIHPPPVSRLS